MSEASDTPGLFLPFSVLDDLRDEAMSRDLALERASQDPVNFFGFGSSRFGVSTLGTQPADAKLLDEGVRGWAATAGTATANRLSGLKLLAGVTTTDSDGKTTVERIDDHIMSGIFQRANPVFMMRDMLWLLTWHLQQVGVGYWQKVRDGIGVVQELWPLPPQNVEMIGSSDQIIAGYEVHNTQGNVVRLDVNDVVRFWRPDPLTLYSTLGKLGPQQVEFDASRFMEAHIKSHFERDATPRIVFEGQKDAAVPGGDTGKDFKKRWRQQFSGRSGTDRGIPAFIPDGWNAKELAAHGGTKEIDPMAARKRDQILSAYGVPKSIVGLVEDVNRNTAEASRFVFDVNTVQPYTALIAESLTWQLAQEYDPNLVAMFKDFVEPDRDAKRADELQDLQQGVRTTQQVLRDRPDGNPDDATWGELPILPLGMAPYTGEQKTFDDEGAFGRGYGLGGGRDDERGEGCTHCGGGSDQSGYGRVDRGGRERDAGRYDRASARDGDPDHLRGDREGSRRLTRADVRDPEVMERRLVAYEKRFLGAMQRSIQKSFAAQLKRILEILDENPPLEFEVPQMRGIVQRAPADEIAARLFNPELWDDLFAVEVRDDLGRAYGETAGQGFVDIQDIFTNAEVPWPGAKALPELSADFVRGQSIKMASDVNSATLGMVKSELESSLRDGDTISQLTKKLKPLFGRNRARRVARTEILGATEAGHFIGWKETGVVNQKRWHNQQIPPDGVGSVRESHWTNSSGQPMDGYTVDFDEDFLLGSGNGASFPRDPRLPAGDRVNCRCMMVPVIPGVEG